MAPLQQQPVRQSVHPAIAQQPECYPGVISHFPVHHTVQQRMPQEATSQRTFNDFMATPMCRNVQERFGALLAMLQEQGVFNVARPAKPGDTTLRIGVPFCGGFFEAPTLAKFLISLLNARALGDTTDIEVLCSDVLDGAAKVALSAVPPDRRIRFVYNDLDLSAQEHPPVDLIFGMQPEITRMDTRDAWQNIVAHCIAASPFSIFTTLHMNEAEVVQQDSVQGGASFAEIRPGLPAGVLPDGSDLSAGYDNLRYCHIIIVQR